MYRISLYVSHMYTHFSFHIYPDRVNAISYYIVSPPISSSPLPSLYSTSPPSTSPHPSQGQYLPFRPSRALPHHRHRLLSHSQLLLIHSILLHDLTHTVRYSLRPSSTARALRIRSFHRRIGALSYLGKANPPKICPSARQTFPLPPSPKAEKEKNLFRRNTTSIYICTVCVHSLQLNFVRSLRETCLGF
jgi:hypothetical protein